MACTEYDEEPDPFTVFHPTGSCCDDEVEDVTSYDPPPKGSELTLQGDLYVDVSPPVSGALLPIGSLGYGPLLAAGLSFSGSLLTNPILSMGPFLWLDAYDPNGDLTHPSNGATLDQWKDKSGNNRHAPYDTTINRKPRFWSVANSGTGSPVALPPTGLPVVSTKQVAVGPNAFQTFLTGAFSLTDYTIFIAGQKVDPPGALTQLGSWCEFGGGADTPMIVGPNSTGPNIYLLNYRNNPIGTPHRVSFNAVAYPSATHMRWTLRKESGAHTCYQGDTSLSVNSTTGTPSTRPFILQFVGRYEDNTGAKVLTQYEFCEIIVFNRAVSTDERVNVWDYLDTKWGLP